jgi:hypothetical protein
MAIDKLPIPPDLASGEIIINGTAVLCNLSLTCAVNMLDIKNRPKNKPVLMDTIFIILRCFNILY